MCGIVGICSSDPRSAVAAGDIDRMCQAIVHRGPDDQGTYIKGPVGLGMRRLSIIDLVSGQQPIHNEDRTIWVVFNGEIYNYPELRAELSQAGHSFYTSSDTEVIPHLYEEHGLGFVRKLRGMFAIALYDTRGQRLLLARDRLGKKPLVYAMGRSRLLFASEIRAVLSVAPELAEVNQEALLHFFSLGYIPDAQTAFTGIKRLPPGFLLEYSNCEVKLHQYWDLPEFREDEAKSEEEWLEELGHELAQSVRLRLISDVPLGALLSGGVDSSTVVALMARASSRVKTFSVAFGQPDFDESCHAQMVAKRFGTEHHQIRMEPDFWATLNRLTGLLEEPFGDSSLLPTYYVSRLVRDHVKVALSGDGGDELFAGYDRYQLNLHRERFSFIPAWAGRLYRNRIFPLLPSETPGRRFLYNMTLPFRDRYIDSVSFLPVQDRASSLFSDDYLKWASGIEPPRRLLESYYDGAPAQNPLTKLQCLDIKTYLAGDILPKVDRMSMAASLETRAPLLDHVFLELVARVPAKWKLHGNESKYLLKKLAERVGVPREVIYRPKKGFAVPLVHWLRNELRDEITEILTEPTTLQRGYFNSSAIRKLLNEHRRSIRDRSSEIWLLLVFELWHRNFLERLGDERLLLRPWDEPGGPMRCAAPTGPRAVPPGVR